jgi:hypothetical protein
VDGEIEVPRYHFPREVRSMIYRTKAMAYIALSLLLLVVARNSDDEPHPLWLVGLLAFGAAALGIQAIRQLRLHHYYEGRRTRLVIDTGGPGARRR